MRNISPFLLSKINKQNQTKWENANPKMSVAIARAKTTVMDSSYWTVETIREGDRLGDISVAPRRFRVTGAPNRIYEIHVENGIVGTAIREYPDKLRDGWKDQFTLGPGSSVAMAFNGHWERYRKLWRLITNEAPHLLWVDGSNKLQTQLWDDETTKQELATNVKYVRAIRGWKNVNFINRDQGIIAAYIKQDGSVWYRNYCDMEDDDPVWENERQLTEFTGLAVSLNLFITNDYRMGFVIEDNLGKINWYITERNWAGMAISPETIMAAPVSVKAEFIPIKYIDGFEEAITIRAVPTEVIPELGYVLTDNEFFNIHNEPVTLIDENDEEYQDWGKVLIIGIENRIVDLSLTDIEIVDSKQRTYAANVVEKIGSQTYRLEFTGLNNFNNVGNVGTLKYKGLYGKNALGELYLPFEKVFNPINLVPTSIPLPEVEAIWNE